VTEPSASPAPLPAARVRAERRFSAAWIIPLLALVLAAWIGHRAWRARGEVVTVSLDDGYGIALGGAVRHRGITVGEVVDLDLARDGTVRLTLRLDRDAEMLARAGTRFWIVRPQIGLGGLEGVETLIGARYVAAVPSADAGAPRQREFVGLAAPPAVESIAAGDLEVIVAAARRGALRPGTPVTYRQVRVGTVLSVGLASDGSAVEARLHVEKAYRALVRQRTRFWSTGGASATVGLRGLTIEMESLEQLLAGGVALATPALEDAGDPVHTGHRFRLEDAPEDDWLAWRPAIAIGSALLPAGASLPRPLWATTAWRQGLLLKGTRSRHGWVLPTEEGLVGPADLLAPDLSSLADEETLSLEVAGQLVALGTPVWSERGLACVDARISAAPWTSAQRRTGGAPEDCIVVGDASAAPFPLAAARLTAADGAWDVDDAIALDGTWHGACVLAREDGLLLGILLVDDDGGARVAFPPGWE
jgi:hypothetical protein